MYYSRRTEEVDPMLENPGNQWAMYIDGASNANGSKARLILISLEGWDIQYTLWTGFSSINNKAEYEALIANHTITKEMGIYI